MESESNELPPGKTCGDCMSFKICVYLVSTVHNSTICDWIPIRFREKAKE